MIILDTNVLSEALKPAPAPIVMLGLSAQERSTVFTTTITQAELFYAVEVLRPGARRTQLMEPVEKIFTEEFGGRILPFDEIAAREFAQIVASRRAVGHPISQFEHSQYQRFR